MVERDSSFNEASCVGQKEAPEPHKVNESEQEREINANSRDIFVEYLYSFPYYSFLLYNIQLLVFAAKTAQSYIFMYLLYTYNLLFRTKNVNFCI